MQTIKLNKYDYLIFVIILCLAGGGLGGAITVSRVLSIAISPILLTYKFRNKPYKNILIFLNIWLFWSIISLIWTADILITSKTIFYNICNFLLFTELLVCADKASRPIYSISTSWVGVFLSTAVIAFWEISTDNHLSISIQESGTYMGASLQRFFASVTFGNLNNYVVFICYCIPFIIYKLVACNSKILRITFTFILAIAYILLIIESSRGGLLSACIMLIIFIWLNKSKKSVMLSMVLVVAVAVYYVILNADMMLATIAKRAVEENGADYTRINAWRTGIRLVIEYFGLGVGAGASTPALSSVCYYRPIVFAPHCAYIELILQYGILISAFVIIWNIKQIIQAIRLNNPQIRLALLCITLAFPFISIINSEYLLWPQLWALFASIYIFNNYEYFQHYNKNLREVALR